MITAPTAWTTELEKEKHNGFSRASTANANGNGNPYLVGVQSRFHRKYLNKWLFICMAVFIVALLAAFISITTRYVDLLKNAVQICDTKECLRAANTLKLNMDASVDPCDDFYRFTCGNWADEHPRPETASSHDWFSERQVKVMRNLRNFLKMNNTKEDGVEDDEPKPVKQIRMMYSACLDTNSMNELGLDPVYEFLESFHLPKLPNFITNNNDTHFNLISSLGAIKRNYGKDIFLGIDLFPDPRNRSQYRIAVGTPESSSELPLMGKYKERIDKFKHNVASKNDSVETEEDQKMIDAYKIYIQKVIAIFAQDNNVTVLNETLRAASDNIFNITRTIYKLNNEVEKMNKSLNPLDDIIDLTFSQMQNYTNFYVKNFTDKGFPFWKQFVMEYFVEVPEVGINFTTDKLLTSKMDLYYLEQIMGPIFFNNTQDILQLFMWWEVVEDLILHTTNELRSTYSDYTKSITSLEGTPSRSFYCTSVVNQLMGMALSYGIADKNFLNETQPKVQTMLTLIRASFNNLVRKLTWMDKETKIATLEKSDKMKSLIGFPEWILDKKKLEKNYKNITINETTHLHNMMMLIKRNIRLNLSNFRKEYVFGWATSPTNVNAFHTFQANAITIPLAILQYPFYNLGLEALNYGAIGSILGHELTHGFDDSGRHFDKDGNMRQWWTNATIKEYVNRTNCFVEQYSSYYLEEIDDFVDGDLTLGENIADNGGLREAFVAYQIYKEMFGQEKNLPGFENYTSDQLFFMSFGNLWCESMTDDSLKSSLEDTHCPGRIRMMGVLSNSPEFVQTFKCKPKSKMVPENTCRIW